MKLMKGTVLAVIDLWRQYMTMHEKYKEEEEQGKLKKHGGSLEAIKNPITHKLHCVIANLDPQARGELVALMWLGRDGGDKSDFEDLAERAISQTNPADASYLSGKQRLDESLLKGMEIIGM